MTLITSTVLTFISISLLECTPIDERKGIITIHNNSPDTVSNVTAKYASSKKEDFIGKLDAAGTYYYEIEYADSEDSIRISYLDKDQKTHTLVAAPYAASYDKHHYTVRIE